MNCHFLTLIRVNHVNNSNLKTPCLHRKENRTRPEVNNKVYNSQHKMQI